MTGWCPNCRGFVDLIGESCPTCGHVQGGEFSDRFFVSGTDACSGSIVNLPQGLILKERFKVLDLCGRGRTGSVYKMFDFIRSETVAAKVRAFAANGADDSARVLHEIRLLERVRDFRHLIRLYDLHEAGWGGGKLLLTTMELADLNLRPWMDLHRNNLLLRREQGIEYVRELCAALVALEDVGIVPLDVKPENAFLAGGVLKLGDLESSLIQGRLPLFAQHDEVLLPRDLGTHGYMSPEQESARSVEEVDIRAAIFAVGVILYEMLDPQGRRPFDDGATPAPLTQSDIPLDSIIRRCLAPNPEHRFASASELLGALDRAGGKAHEELPPETSDSCATALEQLWDAIQEAMDSTQFTAARRLCRRLLTLYPEHLLATETLQDLDERYMRAERLYAAAARDLATQSLEVSAAAIQEAARLYPEHPDGFVVQQHLVERSATYSRSVEHGVTALAEESWSTALECFSQAAAMTPHEPVLTSLVHTLSGLVATITSGRQVMDSALLAGDVAKAFALAMSLDQHVEEVGAALKELVSGVTR